MKLEKVKQHKKYKNEYFRLDKQIYNKQELLESFLLDEKTIKEAEFNKKEKLKKPYRYLNKKRMQTYINKKTKELFESLFLEKAKTVFENNKIVSALLQYFLEELNYNAMILEERLFSLKDLSYELKQNKEQLEHAYDKKLYQTDKQFRKTKSLLKRIEKQTKLQNTKLLFDVLLRKKTTNANDTYALLYLLNKLNVEAYRLTLHNEKENKQTFLVAVSYKKNNYDALKYYLLDVTKLRKQQKHNALKEQQAPKLMGKNTLQKEYADFRVVRIETMNKTMLKQDEAFNKTLKQLTKDDLELPLL